MTNSTSAAAPSHAELILRAVTESMPDIVFVKDLQGKYILVNEATASWLHTTVEAMVGQDDEALFSPEIARQIQADDQRVLHSGQSVSYEEEIIQSGEARSLLTTKFVWRDDNGQALGIAGISRDITERKQSERALRRSEQKLRQVINSLNSYVGVVTPDGILTEVNQLALDAADLKPEEVLGLPFEETHWWAHSPEAQAELRTAIQQAMQGKTIRYDTQVRVADNQLMIIDFSLIPVFDDAGKVEYLVPSGVDITERMQTANALRHSEALNQAILSALPDLIIRMRADGTYLDVKAGNFPLSQTPAEMIGENVRDILSPPVAERRLAAAAKAIATGEMQRYEFQLEIEDKPCRHEVRIVPLGLNEVLVSIRDFSDLHQAEAALSKALQEEQTARQAAEYASRVKDEFLAVLSHELRTPLNPILGWATLLRRGKLSPEKTEMAAETIERNAKLQTQLIDDLLDIARMLRGKLELEAEPVDLKVVVIQALETVQLAAQAKSLQVKTALQAGVMVKGDPTRLQQIVWNLLSNAVKFTAAQGRITVRLAAIDDQACIQVSDTGVGIQPKFLPYVFEHFRQADSTLTRQFGGLGLGLAIVRQLSELHGGTVSVESPGENQGTVFIVRLPLMRGAAVAQVDAFANCQTGSLAQLKVLIVDDDPDSRLIVTEILADKQATVAQASSGLDCLQQLDRSIPDLLICDIGMPDLDGYELIRQIRQRPAQQGGEIPAIALTAYTSPEYEKQAIAAGFQAHLAKPVEVDQLLTAIVSLVC